MNQSISEIKDGGVEGWRDGRFGRGMPRPYIYPSILPYFLLSLIGILLGAPAVSVGQSIGGLGRIVPDGDVIDLSGPPGDPIDSVYVRPGMVVDQGALLVTFKSRAARRHELDLARLALREARESTEKAVAMQQLEIALHEHRVALAARRLERVEEAGGEAFSPRQMEQYTDELFVARNRLEHARIMLEKLKIDREVGIARAARQIDLAQERLNRATVRAPRRGTILEVLARPGETAGAAPLIRMAALDQMYVVCDIFEADLRKLSRGMKAQISSNSLSTTLEGEIEWIGMIIDERSQMGKIRIRLFNAAPVTRLIHMQVNVSIPLSR